jgi:hypothetical protein
VNASTKGAEAKAENSNSGEAKATGLERAQDRVDNDNAEQKLDQNQEKKQPEREDDRQPRSSGKQRRK